MANQPGMFGYERRDEIQDPLAGNLPSNVNLLPVPGPTRGANVDLSGMTREAGELVTALGNLKKPVNDLFAKKRQDWRLEGQLAYAQGVTEEQIAQSGNFYTVQGHRILAAQTSMLEWFQNKQDGILAGDAELDPNTYRANLMKDWGAISESLPDDALVRQLASEQSAELFPRLMQEQTKQHNAFNLRSQRNEWTNNLVAAAGVSLQNNGDMGGGRSIIAEKVEPGASGLPTEMEHDALSDAIVLDFQAGRRVLYDALGGDDGLRGRGFDAALSSKVTIARDQFEATNQADFSKAFQNDVDTIVAGVKVDGNMDLAAQRFDQAWARVTADGGIYGYAVEQTSGIALQGAIAELHGEDWTPEQSRATISALSDPDNKRKMSNLYTSIRTGRIKGDQMTGAIRTLAGEMGLSEQDMMLTMREFDRTVNGIFIQSAAAIRVAGSATLEAQRKQATADNSFLSGSLGYTQDVTQADKQQTLERQFSSLLGSYSANAANGQTFTNSKGQVISPVEAAEGEIMKRILGMNMVWDSAATEMQSAFTTNVVDPKTGAVSDRAVQAMDFIRRMTGEYGATDAQVQKWLGGDGESTSYAARLYYMAQSFDEGGMDTASALRQAQMVLATKRDIPDSTLRSDEVKQSVAAAIDTKFSKYFDIMNGRLGRFSEGYNNGGLGEAFAFALGGRTPQEYENVMKDQNIQNLVAQRARTEVYQSGNTLSWEAASNMAADNILGRGALIGDQFVVSGYGRTVMEDMFAHSPELGSGGPDLAHFATLLYLKDQASKPVEEGGFGEHWQEWKILGDVPNEGIFDGQFWANLGPSALTDQLRENVHRVLRGAPNFKVQYDYQSGMLHVWDYDDHRTDRATGRAMVIPISAIGDNYAKWYADTNQKRNKFWDNVSPRDVPFVPPKGSASATKQTPPELIEGYNPKPGSSLPTQ